MKHRLSTTISIIVFLFVGFNVSISFDKDYETLGREAETVQSLAGNWNAESRLIFPNGRRESWQKHSDYYVFTVSRNKITIRPSKEYDPIIRGKMKGSQFGDISWSGIDGCSKKWYPATAHINPDYKKIWIRYFLTSRNVDTGRCEDHGLNAEFLFTR